MAHHEVTIIGAGPAGLAAACALSSRGISATVFEAGKPAEARQSTLSDDVGSGVGGAGLLSDGKFSYYPSGSSVYALQEAEWVAEAYAWMVGHLETVGIPTVPLPTTPLAVDLNPVGEGIHRKIYPSVRSTPAARRALIRRIMGSHGSEIITGAQVAAVRPVSGGYEVDLADGGACAKRFAGVVLAMGKFGGRAMSRGYCEVPVALGEMRYEFGIRIDLPGALPFAVDDMARDVKLVWSRERVAFRTFCTCEQGELIRLHHYGLPYVAGRSSDERTGRSNFALLARFDGRNLGLGRGVWAHIQNAFGSERQAIWAPLQALTSAEDRPCPPEGHPSLPWLPSDGFRPDDIVRWMGPCLAASLRIALADLASVCPRIVDAGTLCAFPAIESAGASPLLGSDLQASGEAVWCAGDIVGFARGLVPALLTGYYAGLSAAQYLHGGRRSRSIIESRAALPAVGPPTVLSSAAAGSCAPSRDPESDAMASDSLPNTPERIASPRAPMPVVFTAQSKEFFYCRDAVCEFVLSEGAVPLNPFRVFEYFLSDRVDRDLIRQGNNTLIRISDELWVFGSTIADGVLFEILFARQLGKPVRFFSIDNRATGIRALSLDELSFENECYLHYAPKRVTKQEILSFITGEAALGQLSLFEGSGPPDA